MFLIDRLRKKQPEQEGREEQYFPPDLERFRVREEPVPPITSFDMPEKERKFKAFAREMEAPQDIGPGFDERREMAPAEKHYSRNKSGDGSDKIDMVLQKLETIDLRLRVIEEKLERRPI